MASFVKIDPDNLRLAFRRAGITAFEATKRMGYSPTYFNACYSRGSITTVGMKLLQNTCGIQPDEYVVVDEPAQIPVIDYDKLYSTVHKACYEAIKAAFSEA